LPSGEICGDPTPTISRALGNVSGSALALAAIKAAQPMRVAATATIRCNTRTNGLS